MKTVHKFTIPIEDVAGVEMPGGAEILHVGVQRGVVCCWALIDTANKKVRRVFRVAGTGHPIEKNHGEFVGTVILAGGDLVFHIFDLG